MEESGYFRQCRDKSYVDIFVGRRETGPGKPTDWRSPPSLRA
jgi:hypothetical protein